ncbi:hypothetical protein [Pseudomonas fluorescens]|uniref:hypothetical protein n=1 Tax=Pseudomonas fluorescens TaxID=294 RepID=UPI0010F0949F|nr:hypothetical protein [Pseudomonas fluorescens]TCV62766.1 hypothetical protein EDB98_11274 [Pseudomonas fluorescens]
MQFTSEFHTALNAEQTTFRALEAHWQSNPVKWKFWKRPSAEWKHLEAQLIEDYKQACLTLSDLKDTQTPGRKNARYNALKFGVIFALIFFAGIFGLAANHFFNDGQANWMATISAVMTGVGALVALISAFIFVG